MLLLCVCVCSPVCISSSPPPCPPCLSPIPPIPPHASTPFPPLRYDMPCHYDILWIWALCDMMRWYDMTCCDAIMMVPSREQALWKNSAFDMVQQLNQQMRASLWKKCSFKGFVKKTPEKRTFIPQPRFSCFLLIICDNWMFIVFFNIKPSKTTKP